MNAPDQDVDVCPRCSTRLTTILPEQLEKVGTCDHLIVGTEQDARNRQLNAVRPGLGEEARQIFQAFAVADPLPGERIQRAGVITRVRSFARRLR